MVYSKRNHFLHSLLLVAAALIVCAPRAAYAVGETTGRISGSAREATSNKPLAGADVTVSSPALIGGPRAGSVEEDGRFEISDLPPGTYDVEVGYAGTRPARRRIVVRQGETAPLDVKWSAQMVEEQTYQIVEESHLTRPDSTQTGTVIGADTEARLATGRSYQNVVTQIAGVSDPAGRGIPNIKGANRLQNRYLVDGMDVTDSVTNNFSTQVNFDSINSMEVITGGMEAQYNALGGIINLNTLAGGDKLRIDASVYVNSDKFGVANQYGQQLYEHELPFSTVPGVATSSYQANLNVGGPILKGKLWVNFNFEYDYLQSQIPIGPPINLQHPPRVQQNFFPRLKLTWAPSQRHRVTLSANGDPALVTNRDQTNGELPIAEWGQTQGGGFGVLQWDYFHSQHISTQVQAGYNFNHVFQYPQGQFSGGVTDIGRDPRFSDKNYTYDPDRPRHTNADDFSNWYQGIPISRDKRHTIQLDPSLSIRGRLFGDHDAKVGIQSRFVAHHFFRHTPGWSFYNESGGGPGEAGLCDPDTLVGCNKNTLKTDAPDFENNQFGFGVGAYAQDRWRIHPRIVILPGMRVDYGVTQNSLGETVSSLVGFGPRLGVTADLTGDSKTILSAYYGRANDTLNLLPTSRADVDAPQFRYRFDPAQQAFVFDSKSGGAGGYRLDNDHLTPPHTDEVSVSILRELYKNSVAGVNYTYRKISNIWDAVEVNQVWDPSGTRVTGYVNGTPEKVYKYTTPDGNYRIYQGIDFTLESRPNPHLDLYAAYTLSWLYGPGAEEVFTVGTNGSAYYNPRQYKFFDGFLAEDQRHQLKFHGSYEWRGLVVGANLAYASGAPLTKAYWNQSDGTLTNKRTPQGTDPGSAVNDPRAVAAFRLPDTILLNVRASFDFHALIRQHLVAIVDLFNIFNLDAPTGLENRDGPTFAVANKGRLAPFRVQLGLRYTY